MNDTNDLHQIAGRACTLFERLDAPAVADSQSSKADSWIDRWEEAIASGDPQRFEKRLAWDGHDRATIRAALNAAPKSADRLPAWADLLADVLAIEVDHTEPDRVLDPAAPLPFEEVLLPFVRVARRYMLDQAGATIGRLSDDAHTALERALLERLAHLAGQAFELEFSLFRARRRDPFAARMVEQQPGRALYLAFIAGLRGSGLLQLFREYSVLARLLATAAAQWAAATAELYLRLSDDWDAIAATFNNNADPGPVIGVRTQLSDPHCQGRSVIALAFANRLKLVYKPRDLTLEAAFAQLVGWLNERADGLPLDAPQVLNRHTHGWFAYVHAAPCPDQAAVARYYWRCGALLALMHAFEGTDAHHENIIAAGEHPIFIDTETLFHPQLRAQQPILALAEAQVAAATQLWDSVLRTSFLPQWEFDPAGRAVDQSGLGADVEHESGYPLPRWSSINTDQMALRFERITMRADSHLPRLGDTPIGPADFIEGLVEGFETYYRVLMRHCEQLSAPDGPLAAFAGGRVRYILRATRIYDGLLYKTLNPKFLHDGMERSIELDRLSTALLRYDQRPPIWPVIAEERAALDRLDIPLLATRADSAALPLEQGVIADAFRSSGLATARTRLATFGESDLAFQSQIIRGSLYSQIARPPTARHADAPGVTPEGALPEPAELIAAARAIAEGLSRTAVCAPDGSVTWIGLALDVKAQRYQFQPLGEELYNGCCGVALFLAGLASVTGEARWRDLALAALQPIRAHLADPAYAPELVRELGIGGGSGVGSICYALTTVAELLAAPELLDAAGQAAALITPERIAAEQRSDLMEGTAGALLALLKLERRCPDLGVYEAALACGEHLLRMRRNAAAGTAWSDQDGRLLTGFSHGAAGIAYALLQLAARTGQRAFQAAAEDAIVYERGLFRADVGNWPDLRRSASELAAGKEDDWFMTSWCHGAPGIGLARLAGLPFLDDAVVRAEIEVALDTTSRASSDGIDHLCCGNFGHIDILLTAGRRLDRPDLVEQAARRADTVLRRAGPAHIFRLFENLPPGVANPGFHVGQAGIGYALLRLAHPALPAVLVWE